MWVVNFTGDYVPNGGGALSLHCILKKGRASYCIGVSWNSLLTRDKVLNFYFDSLFLWFRFDPLEVILYLSRFTKITELLLVYLTNCSFSLLRCWVTSSGSPLLHAALILSNCCSQLSERSADHQLLSHWSLNHISRFSLADCLSRCHCSMRPSLSGNRSYHSQLRFMRLSWVHKLFLKV